MACIYLQTAGGANAGPNQKEADGILHCGEFGRKETCALIHIRGRNKFRFGVTSPETWFQHRRVRCHNNYVMSGGNAAISSLVGRAFESREKVIEEAQKILSMSCQPCQVICQAGLQLACSGLRQGCKLRIGLSETNGAIKVLSCVPDIFHPTREQLSEKLENESSFVDCVYYQYRFLLKIRFDPKKMYDILQIPLNQGLFPVPPRVQSAPGSDKATKKLLKYHDNMYGNKKIDTIEKVYQLFCAIQVVELGIEMLPPHNLRELSRLLIRHSSSPVETRKYPIDLSSLDGRMFKSLSRNIKALRALHVSVPGYNEAVKHLTYRVYSTKQSGKSSVQIECSEKKRGCPFKLTIQQSNSGFSIRHAKTSNHSHIHSASIEHCALNPVLKSEINGMISGLGEESINWISKLLCV